MKTTLDYALEYIRRGWSVIPLAPRSKAPMSGLRLAPYLDGSFRMNEMEARNVWGFSSPEYGIGIITGRPSGLIVADVDPRNGGRWADHYRPGAHIASTSSGGQHVYYRYPTAGSDVRCGPSAIPGVDRKANLGYVVAPPSVHPSGSLYAWDVLWDEGIVLSPPPTALMEHGISREGSDGPWVAEALANPEGIIPGTQEDTLTRLCWWAAGHLDEDVAQAVLWQWASALPLGNPHEPWTEKHIEDRLSRAYAKREPAPGVAGPIVADSPGISGAWALVDQAATDFVQDAKSNANSVDWYAHDMIAPGCWTEVVGIMKEGKTTLVGGLVRAILHGDTFLDRQTRKTGILWATEQVGISFVATLERARLLEEQNLRVVSIANTFGQPWDVAGAAIVQRAKERECGIIIVDTLARLAGIADEDEARSVVCLNPFLAARAAGIAVVFVRHGRKSGGAINVAARGSGAITGEMDICLRIEAPLGVTSDYRHLDGISRLTDTLDLHLEYKDGAYVLGPDPEKLKQASTVAPIVGALTQAPHGRTTAELVAETELSTSTINNHLRKLVAAGTVAKTGPENKPVYTLLPGGIV